jgi:hypothetical protein
MLLVHLPNTIGMILIIYQIVKNYKIHAVCFDHLQKLCHLFSIRCQRHSRWLSHHWPITNCLYLVLIYRKIRLHIVSPHDFQMNHVSSLNLNKKWKAQKKKFKSIRRSYTGLVLSMHAKKEPKNIVRHSL